MHAGNTDQVLFSDLFELAYMNADPVIMRKIIKLRADANPAELEQAVNMFNNQATQLLAGMQANDQRVSARLAQIKAILAAPLSSGDPIAVVYNKYQASMEVFGAAQSGLLQISDQSLQAFQKVVIDFEKGWNYSNLSDAMAFTREDSNLINYQGQRLVRFFPKCRIYTSSKQ